MGYLVRVADALGNFDVKQFDDKEHIGIADGIVADAAAQTGVGTLSFNGRPDLLNLEKGEVLQAWIEDEGLKPVFYGALITSHKGTAAEGAKGYQASARALLIGSACLGERYRLQDIADIARQIVTLHKHPALKVRVGDFVTTGTVLDKFDATGSLAEVLDELLELTENPDYGTGIDENGYVFFRPNTLKRTIDYEDTDYRDTPLGGGAISTATVWTLETEPAITPWGGAYVPRPFTHVSVPEPGLHEQYGYRRARFLPLNALRRVIEPNYTSSGFTNPANALDENDATFALRGASTQGVFTLNNISPLVMGVRIVYRTTEDAGTVRLRANCGVLYDVELPNSKGEVQPLDIILTPHDGTFTAWTTFRLTANAGGTMELYGFHSLEVNTDYLDGISLAIVPEQRPGQIVEEGIKDVPAIVELKNAPRGTYEMPCDGVARTWNPQDGARTVTNIGITQEEADAEGKTVRIQGYYRRPSR